MIGSKQLKVGMAIIFKGDLYRVMELSHVQPGKGGAFIQAKLRNMLTGLQTEHKYRSGEPVEKAMIDTREVEYISTQTVTIITSWTAKPTTNFISTKRP